MKSSSIVAMTLFGTLCMTGLARAQVAGATTSTNLIVGESTQIAMGWSVKKTLMGKTIYNDVGQKIGTVEDLIISPERNVTYVIDGAGGFVGVGRHDVAIPVAQIPTPAWLVFAHEQDFDLLLMDVEMPVMDGLTATRSNSSTGNASPSLPMRETRWCSPSAHGVRAASMPCPACPARN